MVIAIVILFFGIRYVFEGFTSSSGSFYMSNFDETTQPAQTLPERSVSPSGPSAPNVMLREKMATTLAEPERASDPYDQSEGELPMEDNMRYPERSFGPGTDNNQTDIVGGQASQKVQETHNSARMFSPEFVQNGGYMEDEVVANDTLDEHIYAAF